MIPLRVRMNGWMRYRDEQVADFGGGSLIAIVGENGAGKSSIFDAITYAAYGQHRLGKIHADQLISQDMDRLSVEFEFEADGERYLVRRSRGRKEAERDQSLWVWDEGADDWTQVPGSEKDDALRLAIARIVRLTPEAFTSSFMLKQDEATAFLEEDPKGRFDIIGSLIGLKEYEALERRARDAHKAERIILDKLTADLRGFEGVDGDAVSRLSAEVAAAAERDGAATRMDQAARELLADAGRHARLAAEVAGLDVQIDGAEMLIAEKEQIEKDAALYLTLNGAIDSVARIASSMADARRAAAAASDAGKGAAAIDVDALTARHENAANDAQAATKRAETAERDHVAVTKAEREAYDFAQAARAVIDGSARIAIVDQQLRQLDAQLGELMTVQTSAEGAVAATAKAAEQADAALDAARTETAGAGALVAALKQQLAERTAAARESTCARCGQPIDKYAAKQQIDEVTAQFAAAQEHATAANTGEKQAAAARAAARKRHDDAVAVARGVEAQAQRVDAQLGAAAAERERVEKQLAQHESKLGERLKDVALAADAYNAAMATLDAAQHTLEVAREAIEEARAAEAAARDELATARDRRVALEAESAQRAQEAAGHRQTAEALSRDLGAVGEPALADPADTLSTLRAHRKDLAGAPKRKAALDAAARDHAAWSGQRSAKHDEIAAIPAVHRVDEAAARKTAVDADAAATSARAALATAQQRLTLLEARIEELGRMQADLVHAEARIKRLKKLADLLGKKGLQGLLIADALNAIARHANAFLHRLTGGTLQLVIERGKGDLLELQAIDSTCMREARSPKALSGSQKFRCAVAIASGIGQYAGAGGMRSIVIDEGFGSLDQAGQREMVEELRQLATYMDKVIVVSHLEAFTDRDNFPDQIAVERCGGGSRIRVVAWETAAG
jgi:exonuclease SbcC